MLPGVPAKACLQNKSTCFISKYDITKTNEMSSNKISIFTLDAGHHMQRILEVMHDLDPKDGLHFPQTLSEKNKKGVTPTSWIWEEKEDLKEHRIDQKKKKKRKGPPNPL